MWLPANAFSFLFPFSSFSMELFKRETRKTSIAQYAIFEILYAFYFQMKRYPVRPKIISRTISAVQCSLYSKRTVFMANYCIMYIKQGYALKNWVEGLSDEAFYPWESPKTIRLKLVNPTFATKQKKVWIHR